MKPLRNFPLVLIGLVASIALSAADWPQYRGPNHDGSSSESLRTNWAEKPPRMVWKKSIDPAWSSITVSGKRVFTQVNRRRLNEDREMCVALNADTGAELWATALDVASYPDAGTGSTDGPRSTPTVEGDRVYVFTSYLKLYCLQADTGQVIWSRDFVAEFPGTEVINWQNAASPLLVGDLIFLNSNASLPSGAPGRRLTAVRKSDGVTVWSGQADTMTHATPVYATIAGTPQVVFLTLRGLVGVVPETGRVLWRHSFSPSATSTAATPIVADDYVYASCAYAKGAWTARVSRTGDSFGVGSVNYTGPNSSYQNHWATPVHHDGFLYSVVERSNHSLACFSLAGRTNTWITRTVGSGNPGYASLIKVGGKLLVLTEPGELVLLEPNPQAYTEIARYKALTGTAWNHPAFSNGRIYARSDTQIVALEVAAAVEPLPGLQLSAAVPAESGRLKFRVVASDNSVLTSSHAARLELQLAPVPGFTPPEWQTSPASLIENAGGLEADLPLPAESTLARVTERNSP